MNLQSQQSFLLPPVTRKAPLEVFHDRPYQTAALKAIDDKFAAGAKSLLVVKATGLGKTVFFSKACKKRMEDGERSIIIVHRDELIRQAAKKIESICGIVPGIDKAGERSSSSDQIVIGSVQTLIRRKNLPGDRFGLAIIDECFPAGTLVGDKQIQDLSVGDIVPSYDESNHKFVNRRVARTFRKQVSALLKLKLSNGFELICTPNHPIFTITGWNTAEQLNIGMELLCIDDQAMHPMRERLLGRSRPGGHQDVLGTVRNSQEDDAGAMHTVRDRRSSQRRLGNSTVQENRPGVLLRGVYEGVDVREVFQKNGGYEQTALLESHEDQQSDASRRQSRTHEVDAFANGSSPDFAGWEWARTDCRSAGASRGVGMADGISHSNESQEYGLSTLLQGGCWEYRQEGRSGSGWPISFEQDRNGTGSQEDRVFEWSRLDCIEVLEPGSDGTFGGVCADRHVYNIEVEETHTYIANGVVVHNCHHCTSDNTYGGVLENLSPPNLLGVTATPWRSDKKKLAGVFEDTAFTMTLMDGIQQGYLVDIKVKTMPVKIDLSDVKSNAGDFSESDLGDALEPMLDQLADIVARDYADKKILAFLPLVENSQLWTKKLCERGLFAEHVDGESQDREAILARFHTGETMQLSCSMLLTEGYDEPTIDIVMPLRATRSRALFSQILGRGTRPLWDGPEPEALEDRLAAIAKSKKPHLLVLDPVFISERHNVITVADIATEEDGQAGRVNEIMRKKDKLLDEAIEEDNASQHERLAKALRENAHRSAYEKAIAELAFTLDISGLKEWEPTHEWHKEQASQRQVEALARCGVDTSVISCKGMASVVMDSIVKRRDQGLATLKQVRMLLRLGHPAPDKITFADASAEIDRRLHGGRA